MSLKPRVVACELLASLLAGLVSMWPVSAATAPAWKAGVAAVSISPETNMWMAGYASRTKPSEGKAQELFAKALALEDAQHTRFVIVTLDLIGIPRTLRNSAQRIRALGRRRSKK